MKLVLKNIGKVTEADVEITGITVIAGENDTGKSTVGKALFSVFNSFYNIDKKIVSERMVSIDNQLTVMFRESSLDEIFSIDTSELTKEIITLGEKKKLKKELQDVIFDTIVEFDEKISDMISEAVINDTAERIGKILLISDEEILKSILQKNLDAEFQGQIGNIFFEGESTIQLGIRNDDVTVTISNNKISDLSNSVKLGTEAIYIDDPFVLDELTTPSTRMWFGATRYLDHRAHLKNRLNAIPNKSNVVDEIVTNEKFEQIYQKISTVCTGDVVKEKRSTVGYRIGNHRLEIKNMSTGLKAFAILKRLLTNRCIEMNGTIILDEPEIHLHPEWQIVFAELIVLLHKEFGLHILLNTHSPYFLNAIEVYAVKYSVTDQCKYYLAQDENMISRIEDVTDHIEEIYRKLARPLQVLENERYRYE